MAFGFRDYLKAELLTELLSSLFLGGKHPRITSFFLLLFLGIFLIFGAILKGIFHFLGWIFSGGKSGKIRKSFASLKKAAKLYRDKVSNPVFRSDGTGEKWWNTEVSLFGNENVFSFFVHTTTGELRAFFGQRGVISEPIALGPYLVEIARRREHPIQKESDVLGEVYRLLRTQYRPALIFL